MQLPKEAIFLSMGRGQVRLRRKQFKTMKSLPLIAANHPLTYSATAPPASFASNNGSIRRHHAFVACRAGFLARQAETRPESGRQRRAPTVCRFSNLMRPWTSDHASKVRRRQVAFRQPPSQSRYQQRMSTAPRGMGSLARLDRRTKAFAEHQTVKFGVGVSPGDVGLANVAASASKLAK
jgi:hypothetical protein